MSGWVVSDVLVMVSHLLFLADFRKIKTIENIIILSHCELSKSHSSVVEHMPGTQETRGSNPGGLWQVFCFISFDIHYFNIVFLSTL